MTLGKIIRERRKKLSLTQAELAKGICVQSMLSKVERDELIPNDSMLKGFSEKLNLSINELKKYIKVENDQKYIQDLKEIIRAHLEKREYDVVSVLLGSINQKDYELNEEDIAFFSWIEATIYYYETKDSAGAINKFNTIDLSNISSDLLAEIKNAIGRIYYLSKNYSEAIETFKEAVFLTKGVSMHTKVKLAFNLSLSLEETNEDEEALELVIQSIDLLVKNNSLFLLGDLYHTKGFLLRKFNQLEEARKSNYLALSIFEIQNNNEFKAKTQLEINELDNALSKFTTQEKG